MSEQPFYFAVAKTILETHKDWTIVSYKRTDGRELHEHPFPLNLSVEFIADLETHIIQARFHNGTDPVGSSFAADLLIRTDSFNAYECEWIEEEGEMTISNELESYTFYTEARWTPGA